MNQQLSPREWEEEEARKERAEDEQERRARHLPTTLLMSEDELGEVIAHHDYQTKLWGPKTNPHGVHKRWAAGLRTIRAAMKRGELF